MCNVKCCGLFSVRRAFSYSLPVMPFSSNPPGLFSVFCQTQYNVHMLQNMLTGHRGNMGDKGACCVDADLA